MHLKRWSMPKTWPLQKKGTKYVARPFSLKTIPLIVVLRDILKLARTRKEIKKILNSGKIKINEKIARNIKFPLGIFDILSLDGKSFKVIIKNKKFSIEETKDNSKIAKIICKRILKNKKVQINLSDGRNFLTKEKANVGDSTVTSLKDKKIEILPFKQNAKVVFIKGKHLGEEGAIEKIEGKILVVKIKNEKINARKESLMVVR